MKTHDWTFSRAAWELAMRHTELADRLADTCARSGQTLPVRQRIRLIGLQKILQVNSASLLRLIRHWSSSPLDNVQDQLRFWAAQTLEALIRADVRQLRFGLHAAVRDLCLAMHAVLILAEQEREPCGESEHTAARASFAALLEDLDEAFAACIGPVRAQSRRRNRSDNA